MGPLINYREERANARDEREVFISGRHYRRQDDADGIITRPRRPLAPGGAQALQIQWNGPLDALPAPGAL